MSVLIAYLLVGLLLAELGRSAALRRGGAQSLGAYVVTLTVWPYILIRAIIFRR